MQYAIDFDARPGPLTVVQQNIDQFSSEFLAYLPDNLHVYEAFEREALAIVGRGIKHYSAHTIIHVLRHHSALAENSGDGWKINDHVSPYLARLFVLMYPQHIDLFEFRIAKSAARDLVGA